MFSNILIVGCGLIGSSILRGSLNKKISKNIYVFEKSKKNISLIKKIDKKIKFLNKIDYKVSNMDLIVLSTHMSQYNNLIKKLLRYISSKNLITDTGSTKRNVENLINKNKKLKKIFIPSHPIAGSEVSGPEFGDKNLFKDKWCIILKGNDKSKKNQKKIEKFWKKLGSKIIFMNSIDHDKIFSITSHLPHLIAYNLVKTAIDFQKKNKKSIIKYSAGGLRDFSRTAASNEIMWRDIFFENKDNIIDSINIFIRNLKNFKKLIKNQNNINVLKILKNSKKVRKQIINLKQDVSKPNFGRDTL
ncbi:prephenate dehydrogenase [Candidatus Pelagibacter communis]|uniref:prephenate dehydrogenase n=1 Tax=Pelagibacter ubique TaxID=198252 RepID=UPI00094C99AD|nr:prephenate dehydrogenase/arogenate dehydrogenase family protein [Candidatus Pelagibacter ubique]